MEPHHEQRQGIAVAIVTYAVWGVLTIYWKQLHQFDAFELIGWRVLTSAATMVVILTATRRWPDVRRLLRPVNWSTYVWAVVEGHVVEAALGYFISPILTTVIGVVVLRERLSGVQRAAVSLAGAGLLVLTLAYGRVPWIALAIAGSWCAYGYLKKRTPLAPLEGLAAEIAVLILPALALVAIRWGAADGVPATASGPEWILVLLAGLVTAGPLLLFGAASQRTPLTVLGPMQYVVPTVNFLIGWLGFGEEVTRAKFAGFGMIWACLALVLASFVRGQRAATAGRAAGSSPPPPA